MAQNFDLGSKHLRSFIFQSQVIILESQIDQKKEKEVSMFQVGAAIW